MILRWVLSVNFISNFKKEENASYHYIAMNVKVKVIVTQLCPALCYPMNSSLPDSCPWNSPGENTGVGCHSLLQGIFLTQGWNLSLLIAGIPKIMAINQNNEDTKWL